MSILFINGAFRKDSRTHLLARYYLSLKKDTIETVETGDCRIQPFDRERLEIYNRSVAEGDFQNEMFDAGKRFREAKEIVIAAPFWNYSIPAALHSYLEMVCSQGVTFDIDETGVYHSLCRADKLTVIITAGGSIPENDHAFGYIKDLAEIFWNIPEIRYYRAEDLDAEGTDVEKALESVRREMRKEIEENND